MTLLTLNDLRLSSNTLTPQHSLQQQSELQTRLDLVLRQAQLGLDTAALIASDPELERLVEQINILTPSLFQPHPQLRLGVDLSAPLQVQASDSPVRVQATVHLGYRRSVPKLFDWSLRRPNFNWQDAVKLWVTSEFYQDQGIVPSQLKLVAISLHPTQPPIPVVFEWNRRLHQQTERWLVQRVQGEPEIELPQIPPQAVLHLQALTDLDQIPEVAI